ncbi:MAG: hypothetical protein ACXIUM_10165 [Wenzhouxiangella sp.]
MKGFDPRHGLGAQSMKPSLSAVLTRAWEKQANPVFTLRSRLTFVKRRGIKTVHITKNSQIQRALRALHWVKTSASLSGLGHEEVSGRFTGRFFLSAVPVVY